VFFCFAQSVKGKPDEVDVEMPVSGTVSRLKDKFVEHRSDYRRNENGYRRSKSSDNVFDQGKISPLSVEKPSRSERDKKAQRKRRSQYFESLSISICAIVTDV